jgi:hypothetical protein
MRFSGTRLAVLFLSLRRDAGGVLILSSGRVVNCGLKPGSVNIEGELCRK